MKSVIKIFTMLIGLIGTVMGQNQQKVFEYYGKRIIVTDTSFSTLSDKATEFIITMNTELNIISIKMTSGNTYVYKVSSSGPYKDGYIAYLADEVYCQLIAAGDRFMFAPCNASDNRLIFIIEKEF